MKTLTFYDFTFRARHALKGRAEAAAHPHWHTYTVRLWFQNAPDQDQLSDWLEHRYAHLHGCDLNAVVPDSTDEGLAAFFLSEQAPACVRVRVTNDGRRGAEAEGEVPRAPSFEGVDEFAHSRRTS